MIELTDASARIWARETAEPTSLLTRRIYDALPLFYGLSTQLLHSRAHRAALAASSLENGMRVLEVAMGSGEMFRRLLMANPDGQTIGVDLSPKMAAHSHAAARRRFPKASAQCQAADARYLPFRNGHFHAVLACYLFELLPERDVATTLREFRRVLGAGGRLTMTFVAQDSPRFNALYRVGSKVAPAFWGRQVDAEVSALLPRCGFRVQRDTHVRQLFYSSRVVSAVRTRG
jgi:ubiquinone/menaquinone biosynthesis C-methylase UbiE